MIDDIEKTENDEDEGGSGTGRPGGINTTQIICNYQRNKVRTCIRISMIYCIALGITIGY